MKDTIKHNYQECLSLLKTCKLTIAAVAATFAVGIILGLCFPEVFAEHIKPIIKELIANTAGLSGLALVLFIFHNNLLSAFIGMLSGLLFSIIPFAHALANGIVLGFVLQRTHEATGSSHWWQLIPHGTLELPAIFIALGLGAYLGLFWTQTDKKAAFKARIIPCLKTFVLIITPMLAIAATIEGLRI
jgi:stage II sporulation protein M